jgi:hypothetical protein
MRPFRKQPSKLGSEGGHKVFIFALAGSDYGSLTSAPFLDNE